MPRRLAAASGRVRTAVARSKALSGTASGAGGRRHSLAAKIVARQEYAGYWEYLIDGAKKSIVTPQSAG